jgi:hypothetical protein
VTFPSYECAETKRYIPNVYYVMVLPVFLVLLTGASVAIAQQAQPQPTGPEPFHGMTVKEKLHYDAQHLFDIENLVFAGIGAGFDQARDRPGEWGEGGGPFAERYASHIGYYLVQRSIMFPVRAIDHEDARYFPSKHTNYAARAGDAFLHTVWKHSDSGGMMPAYSEILGDYGAAAVSRIWWPDHYHTGSAIFIAGSDTILVDGGINLFHEFKPDIKRWLHMRR